MGKLLNIEPPRISSRAFGRRLGQAIATALRDVSRLSVRVGEDEAQSPFVPCSSSPTHDQRDVCRRPRSTRPTRPRDVSSLLPIVRPPLTPIPTVLVAPTRRATQRRPRTERGDYDDCMFVDSRYGEVEVRGPTVGYIKEFHPWIFDVPDHIPIGEMVEVWDRRWIVQQSQIHPEMGLGLFALEDIIVPSDDPQHPHPHILPYAGTYYSWGHWSVITKAAPSFAKFSLSADAYPRSDGTQIP